MFERILVPIEYSEYFTKAIDCINQFHDVEEVILLNVITRDLNTWVGNDEDELRNARAKLEEHANHIRSAGLILKPKVEMLASGEKISNAIHRIADEKDVSLILMGAECRRNLENIPSGSVSKDLLCHDDTHLMIVYQEPMSRDEELERAFCSNIFENVLLPMDFSQNSRTAIFFRHQIKRTQEYIATTCDPGRF